MTESLLLLLLLLLSLLLLILLLLLLLLSSLLLLLLIILVVYKKKFSAQHIKMVNLTEHELRLVAKNRGIKNYKNMSREKLFSTLDETKRNLNTSEKGSKRIKKVQNLLQNELNQIMKMHDQSRDELKQIAKIRRIKNYKKMSK